MKRHRRGAVPKMSDCLEISAQLAREEKVTLATAFQAAAKC